MTWTIKGPLDVPWSVKGKEEKRLARKVLQTCLKTHDSLFPRNIKLASVVCLRDSPYRLPWLIWSCDSNKMLNWEKMFCFGSNAAKWLVLLFSFACFYFTQKFGFFDFHEDAKYLRPPGASLGKGDQVVVPRRTFAPWSWAPSLLLALHIPGRRHSRGIQGVSAGAL